MKKLFKEFLHELKLIRKLLERIAESDEAWTEHNMDDGTGVEISDEDLKNYIL